MKKLLIVLMILAFGFSISAYEMSSEGTLEFGTAWVDAEDDADKVISDFGDFEIEWGWEIDENNFFGLETEMDISEVVGKDFQQSPKDDLGVGDDLVSEDGKATFYVEEWAWECNLSGVLGIDALDLLLVVGQSEWKSESFNELLELSGLDTSEYEWANEIQSRDDKSFIYSLEAGFAENYKVIVSIDPNKNGDVEDADGDVDYSQDQMPMMMSFIYEKGSTAAEVMYTNGMDGAGDNFGSKIGAAGSDNGFMVISAAHSMALNEEMVLALGAAYRTTLGDKEVQDEFTATTISAKLNLPMATLAAAYRAEEWYSDAAAYDLNSIIIEATYDGIEGLQPFLIAVMDVDSPEGVTEDDNGDPADLDTIPVIEIGVSKTLGSAIITAGYIVANNDLTTDKLDDASYYGSPYAYAYGDVKDNAFYISCTVEW